MSSTCCRSCSICAALIGSPSSASASASATHSRRQVLNFRCGLHICAHLGRGVAGDQRIVVLVRCVGHDFLLNEFGRRYLCCKAASGDYRCEAARLYMFVTSSVPPIPMSRSMAAASSALCRLSSGVNAADAIADRDAAEQLAVVEAADLSRGGIEEEILPGRRRAGTGTVDVPGRVDPQRQVAQLGGRFSRTAASNDFSLLNTLLRSASPGAKKIVRSQAIFQRSRRRRNCCHRPPSSCRTGSGCLCQRATCHQQRPFGQLLVLVEVLQRIAGKQVPLAFDEQFLQPQVDRPHRAMEVDRAEQLGPHRDEPHQRRQPALVDRQPLAR